MSLDKDTIGIIGLGAVGTASMIGMKPHHEVVGYDIDGRGDWAEIVNTRAALVCVSTNLDKEMGVLDLGPVKDVAARLAESEYRGLVIYKSTLNVGTMDSLEEMHPNLRLVYMPEFLREKDAVEWFADPDRLIASGNAADVKEALSLFEWVDSQVPRISMKHTEAEIGKLAHNAYIATKVTFTCEIERLCILHDVNPHPVMETVWRDRRVLNPAHLTPGLGGFDGKCVPKDTRALASIDNSKQGLLNYILKIGTKKVVDDNHAKAKKQANEKTTDDDKENRGILRDLGDGIGMCLGILIYCMILLALIFPYYVGILVILDGDSDDEYEGKQYILSTSGSISFELREQDLVAILDYNSSTLGEEWSSSTNCWGEECTTWVDTFPVLLHEIDERTFALSGTGNFIADCFGNTCAITGKVIHNDSGGYFWIHVAEYIIEEV